MRVLFIAIFAALATSSLASARLPQSTLATLPQSTVTTNQTTLTLAEAYETALAANKPAVVYVGMYVFKEHETKRFPNAVVTFVGPGSLPGYPGSCVVVFEPSNDGKMREHATYSQDELGKITLPKPIPKATVKSGGGFMLDGSSGGCSTGNCPTSSAPRSFFRR